MIAFADALSVLEAGDLDAALRLADAMLDGRPGDDAAHALRARALMALGRLDDAERDAQAAVRLDPEEVGHRELLAEVLSRAGAHREAADEYRRLARNHPRQAIWALAEAGERVDASDPERGVSAARAAVRLEPDNGLAHLVLAQALTRTGDARGAVGAASTATRLLPGDASAREALADARWLANQDGAAFGDFRTLAAELRGDDRTRVLSKASAVYRQHAGWAGRLLAGIGPAFDLAFSHGWLRVQP